MRNMWAVAVLLLAALPAAANDAYIKCGYDLVRVHSEPSASSPLASSLNGFVKCGDHVTVLDQGGAQFMKVQTDAGVVGWVWFDYLTPFRPAEAGVAPCTTSTWSAAQVPTSGPPDLTNAAVISMLKDGLSPEIVVAKIESSSCNFDTSPTSLKSLKDSGVPDAVMLAMVKAPKYAPNSEVLAPKPTVSTASTVPSPAVSAMRPTIPSNELRAIAWRGVPWTTTSYYQQQGSARTNCSGSGTWFGNMSQSNMQCDTRYTPAQNVPINWTHYTVYNLVETANSYMVIGCTRNFAWSKCTALIPGDTFSFERKGGKVAVIGQREGKNKTQSLDFDIVSSQFKQ